MQSNHQIDVWILKNKLINNALSNIDGLLTFLYNFPAQKKKCSCSGITNNKPKT